MTTGLHYNLDLPEDLSSILEQDFWMLENISPIMFSSLSEPVKFAATTWIIVFKGSCRADINLVTHEISSENLFMFLNSSPLASVSSRHPVVNIPEDILPHFSEFIRSTKSIVAASDNPYGLQALLFNILLFIHRYGYKCYEPFKDEIVSRQGRMSDQFLALVQQNFRKERFLEFYASKLEVTPKHLSRTIKKQTGYTAVE